MEMSDSEYRHKELYIIIPPNTNFKKVEQFVKKVINKQLIKDPLYIDIYMFTIGFLIEFFEKVYKGRNAYAIKILQNFFTITAEYKILDDKNVVLNIIESC